MFLPFITIWSREQRIAWTENRDREVVRRTSCERSSRPNRWRGHLLSPKYRARANASLIPCIHDPSFSSNVHLWRPANGLLVPRRPVHHLPSYQVLYRWLMSPRLAFRSNTVPMCSTHKLNKNRKLLLDAVKDCSVWQTGWSAFIDSDGSQGRRRCLTRVLLLQLSNIWTKDSQEPRQTKGLKWRILDLIYEKKKNLRN
jgi:hypothetical protein